MAHWYHIQLAQFDYNHLKTYKIVLPPKVIEIKSSENQLTSSQERQSMFEKADRVTQVTVVSTSWSRHM